jgi:hypothetical protein
MRSPWGAATDSPIASGALIRTALLIGSLSAVMVCAVAGIIAVISSSPPNPEASPPIQAAAPPIVQVKPAEPLTQPQPAPWYPNPGDICTLTFPPEMSIDDAAHFILPHRAYAAKLAKYSKAGDADGIMDMFRAGQLIIYPFLLNLLLSYQFEKAPEEGSDFSR